MQPNVAIRRRSNHRAIAEYAFQVVILGYSWINPNFPLPSFPSRPAFSGPGSKQAKVSRPKWHTAPAPAPVVRGNVSFQTRSILYQNRSSISGSHPCPVTQPTASFLLTSVGISEGLWNRNLGSWPCTRAGRGKPPLLRSSPSSFSIVPRVALAGWPRPHVELRSPFPLGCFIS